MCNYRGNGLWQGAGIKDRVAVSHLLAASLRA